MSSIAISQPDWFAALEDEWVGLYTGTMALFSSDKKPILYLGGLNGQDFASIEFCVYLKNRWLSQQCPNDRWAFVPCIHPNAYYKLIHSERPESPTDIDAAVQLQKLIDAIKPKLIVAFYDEANTLCAFGEGAKGIANELSQSLSFTQNHSHTLLSLAGDLTPCFEKQNILGMGIDPELSADEAWAELSETIGNL